MNASSESVNLMISSRKKVEQRGNQTTNAVKFIREEFDVRAGLICLLKISFFPNYRKCPFTIIAIFQLEIANHLTQLMAPLNHSTTATHLQRLEMDMQLVKTRWVVEILAVTLHIEFLLYYLSCLILDLSQ